MKVKGFELKIRTAYREEVARSSGESIALYGVIIYDSISRNWNILQKLVYRWKYSPDKLLKTLEKEDILKAVKHIYTLEKKPEKEQAFLDLQLGLITFEEYQKWLDEALEIAKANKKKMQEYEDIGK